MRFGPLMPFSRRDIVSGRDPFDHLRREMGNFFGRTFGELEKVNGVRINVADRDKEMVITAELPGVNENEIQVNLNDGVLTIQGEKKVEKEEEKDNFYVMERSYGSFSRSVSLPFHTTTDQIDASLEKGILTIRIPKPEQVQKGSGQVKVKKK